MTTKRLEFVETIYKCPECGEFKVYSSIKLKLFVCWSCHWIDDECPKEYK